MLLRGSQAKAIDQKVCVKRLCDIVGKEKVLAIVKEAKDRAAAAAPLLQPAALPQQQPAVDVGTKRPGMEGSAGDADAKRLRTAATEGGSGAGSALTSNYAAAAAAAEGAPTGGDAEDTSSANSAFPSSPASSVVILLGAMMLQASAMMRR